MSPEMLKQRCSLLGAPFNPNILKILAIFLCVAEFLNDRVGTCWLQRITALVSGGIFPLCTLRLLSFSFDSRISNPHAAAVDKSIRSVARGLSRKNLKRFTCVVSAYYSSIPDLWL